MIIHYKFFVPSPAYTHRGEEGGRRRKTLRVLHGVIRVVNMWHSLHILSRDGFATIERFFLLPHVCSLTAAVSLLDGVVDYTIIKNDGFMYRSLL